jgi:uncharacterized protein YceK
MINKKAVLVLILVALLLAGFSIVYSMIDSGEEVSTTNYYTNINTEDSEGGMVGVKVSPPVIEDKNG